MASVVEGAGKGAAVGSAAGPWGALAGGVIGAGATLWGNAQEQEGADKAKAAYAEQANKGINTLQSGRAETVNNFDPYLKAGKAGAEGTVEGIQGRVQADQPTTTNASPGLVLSDYLNPSAAYTTRLANDSIRSQALAGGAAGGGMLKALSDNANKMAMTNYNEAFNQMLGAGKLNFDQGQQIYTNKTVYDQSQIDNNQRLMNTGVTANTSLGNISQAYDKDINTAYTDLGNSMAGGDYLKGRSANAATQQSGNLLAKGSQDLIGSYLSGGDE